MPVNITEKKVFMYDVTFHKAARRHTPLRVFTLLTTRCMPCHIFD
jgi:hypothetical protein